MGAPDSALARPDVLSPAADSGHSTETKTFNRHDVQQLRLTLQTVDAWLVDDALRPDSGVPFPLAEAGLNCSQSTDSHYGTSTCRHCGASCVRWSKLIHRITNDNCPEFEPGKASPQTLDSSN